MVLVLLQSQLELLPLEVLARRCAKVRQPCLSQLQDHYLNSTRRLKVNSPMHGHLMVLNFQSGVAMLPPNYFPIHHQNIERKAPYADHLAALLQTQSEVDRWILRCQQLLQRQLSHC